MVKPPQTLIVRRAQPSPADPLPRWARPLLADIGRRYVTGRGLHRIFNTAGFYIYRSNVAPPEEADTPWDFTATLPYSPTGTFSDGVWYISMRRTNGILTSPFLAIGQAGETYIRLEIVSGDEVSNPPYAPQEFRLELDAGGVVRVLGLYSQTGALRADEWAIAYTTNGSTPATDSPDETVGMRRSGIERLAFDLPAQSHGTTVKVRLQVRRNDGTSGSPDWVYSAAGDVLTAIADAEGPTVSLGAQHWPGQLFE